MSKTRFLLVVFSLALASTSVPARALAFGPKRVALDTGINAVAGDDQTGLVDCRNGQVQPGFCYLRVLEGPASAQSLDFIGPPASCKEDACVFVKIYNTVGQVAWGGEIPKGKTRVTVPWWQILGCSAPPASCDFVLGSRGFWSFTHEVHFLDQDGNPRVTKSTGDMILRVMKKGYEPLDRVENDANYRWEWVDHGLVYRMTTGLRAFVGVP